MEKMEIETDYTREITCPYCGHVFSDSWEVNQSGGMEWDAEVDCGECDETFIASRNVSVTYSTRKRDQV